VHELRFPSGVLSAQTKIPQRAGITYYFQMPVMMDAVPSPDSL
jgi:hypothetical protein